MRVSGWRPAVIALVASLLLIPPSARAQQNSPATIRGQVVDAGGAPLGDVRVSSIHPVSGLRFEALTGSNGTFSLDRLPAGVHRLANGRIGYGTDRQEVRLTAGEEAVVRITLVDQAVLMDPLLVAGTRSAQARALEQKMMAANVREIVVADDVGKLPDRGLADAIGRLPGVSVQQGVGDGQYVSIRGVSPGLNQVNVNGQTSAISDVDARAGRSGPLDVVGSGDFATIEVIKTLTPELDAQGLGGQINVSTPSALDRGQRFSSLQADYGGNGLNDRRDYAFTFGGGDVFLDRRLGAYLGGTYSTRDFTFDRLEGSWGSLGSDVIPARQMLKLVEEDRRRWSVSTNLEFDPREGSRLYFRSVFNQADDIGLRDEVEMRIRSGAALTSPTQGTAASTSVALKTRTQDSRRQIGNLTLGADHTFGSARAWRLQPSVTFSTASEDRDIVFVDSEMFSRVPTSFQTNGYIYSIETEQRFNAEDIRFRRLRFDGGLQSEDLWVVQNDLGWSRARARIFGRAGSLSFKTGGKITLRNRFVDEYSNRWVPLERTSLDGLAVGGPDDFRDRFAFGPRADANRVIQYFEANRGGFSFDSVSSLTNSVEDDYDAEERIYAGFLQSQVQVGGLTLLGGVRVEHTDLTMGATQATFIDDEFQGLSPRSLDSSYTNVFPNLQLRYAASSRLVARAAVTTSLGRPDFVDLAPITTLEAIESEPGVFVGSVEEGNPALEPYEALNLDAGLEYYFAEGGLASVSIFRKTIDNPVFVRRDELADVDYEGRFFDQLTLTTTRNAESGFIQGVEFGYQQQFTALPGLLSGLGASLNATFIGSEVRVFDRDDELPFFDQPDRIYNAQLFYERAPLQARVSYQQSSETLRALSGSREFDVYEDRRETVDAKVTLQVQGNAFIFVEGENLTNEDRRRFQGRRGRLLLDERFGSAVRAGISWRF